MGKGFTPSLNGSKSLIFLPHLAPSVVFVLSKILTELKVSEDRDYLSTIPESSPASGIESVEPSASGPAEFPDRQKDGCPL